MGSDVRSAILEGSFPLKETKVIDRCQEALAPETPIERMIAKWNHGNIEIAYQPTVVAKTSAVEKIKNQPLREARYTGNCGYQLSDVYMVVANALKNSNEDNLQEALKKGTLDRAHLVRSAKNILGALMRSPVMERSLNRMSEEEKESLSQMKEEDKVDFNMEYLSLNGTFELDGSTIDTSKGTSVTYGLLTEQLGLYEITMEVKVDGNNLVQVPVTISANNAIQGTITMNGTDGEYVEVKQTLAEFTGTNNFVTLFFAQGGMQIKRLVISKGEPG